MNENCNKSKNTRDTHGISSANVVSRLRIEVTKHPVQIPIILQCRPMFMVLQQFIYKLFFCDCLQIIREFLASETASIGICRRRIWTPYDLYYLHYSVIIEVDVN